MKVEPGAFQQGQPVHVDGKIDHWQGGTAFRVEVESSSLQKTAAAVQVAVSRMYVVEDDGGTELTRAQYEDTSRDWATPNYISLTTQNESFAIYLNYKGAVGAVTLKTLVAILVDELQRGSVDAAVLRFAPPDNWGSWQELDVWVCFSR